VGKCNLTQLEIVSRIKKYAEATEAGSSVGVPSYFRKKGILNQRSKRGISENGLK
jgi:hypothetical protein